MKYNDKIKENLGKIALSSILLAVSIILSYIENLLPFSTYGQGIRIGIANICVILGLFYIGKLNTFIITLLKVLLLSLVYGNMVRFLMSLSGFIISYFFMLVYFNDKCDIIILSIIGGVFHILGQFIILIILLKNYNVLYLLPIYLLIGMISGFVIGLISNRILISRGKVND